MKWIKICFQKYFTFSGRASRAEFWYFQLFVLLLTFVASFIDIIFAGIPMEYALDYAIARYPLVGPITGLFLLATFFPNWTVTVRRLHDIGKSGWWILLGLVPLIGFLILLSWYIRDSEPWENEYGPNPKLEPSTDV